MASSINIQFNYMYRDAGNYKFYGEMIFPIIGNADLAQWEVQVKSALIDGMYFDPVKWNVHDVREEEWDEELDHEWFEFLSLSMTDSDPDQEINWEEWFQRMVNVMTSDPEGMVAL